MEFAKRYVKFLTLIDSDKKYIAEELEELFKITIKQRRKTQSAEFKKIHISEVPSILSHLINEGFIKSRDSYLIKTDKGIEKTLWINNLY